MLRLTAGIAVGLVLAAVLMKVFAPGIMIVTRESKLGFDETVERLSENVESADGWVLQKVADMQASLKKQGVDFPRRVQKLSLCNPRYAAEVLESDTWASSLMPCGIAVWEDEEGRVWVSKMNTGLMGKLFGGTIADVMGGDVAADEQRMMAGVVH